MKFLKYLLLGLVLSTLPACAAAQNFETTWSTGDKVVSYYICRTEEDIMEVALADSKGKHALRESVFKKNIARDCMNLNPPLGFIVTKIIGSYIDSNQNETTILAISIPSKTEIAGYIISIGKPKMGKGI